MNWKLRCTIVLGLLLVRLGLTAAAVPPETVPTSEIEDVPYRFVGTVRTGPNGPDPAVYGTGWMAGTRVVVTAAHVFFEDDTLGWSRNTWYWQRVTTPDTFWSLGNAEIPRTYVALAGYAAAAGRYAADPDSEPPKILDAFNRDTLALKFYQPLLLTQPFARAVNALGATGNYSIVGYPAKLGAISVSTYGQLYAHRGGRSAAFVPSLNGPDFQGYSNATYQTNDLMSGPGNSGGPVLKEVSGSWLVAGVLVGGVTDGSAAFVRAIDAESDAMIQGAVDDSLQEPSSWQGSVGATVIPPIRRRDGSMVVAAGGDVRALDDAGVELWRRPLLNATVHWLAEAPDGRILAGVNQLSLAVVALEGATGRVLWRCDTHTSRSGGAAVGERGDIYVGTEGGVLRISAQGDVVWRANLGNNGNDVGIGEPAIAPDGSVVVTSLGRVVVLDAATGDVLRSTETMNGLRAASLGVEPDGAVAVIAEATLHVFNADLTSRWSLPLIGIGPVPPALLPDGTIVVAATEPAAAIVVGPDGMEKRRLLQTEPIVAINGDPSGNLYVGLQQHVRKFDATGALVWEEALPGSQVFLGRNGRLHCLSETGATVGTFAVGDPAAGEVWQGRSGGFDNARRVFNAVPVAPAFVAAPQDQRGLIGYRLELNAVADGSFPLTYEWRKDGELIGEQIGPRLIVPVVSADDAGQYTVTVRNPVGEVTSAPFVVTVAESQFGERLWFIPLENVGAPAIADDGTVFALGASVDATTGQNRTDLLKIDPSGNEVWRREVDGAVPSPILRDDGGIYVVQQYRISTFDADGNVLWEAERPFSEYSSSLQALGPANELIHVSGNRMASHDAAGREQWGRYVDHNGLRSLAVRRDGSFVVTASTVELFSPTGERMPIDPIVPIESGGPTLIGPDDEIIVIDHDYHVVTLNRDGKLFDASVYVGPTRQPLLRSDGMLATEGFQVPFMGGTTIPGGIGYGPIAILEGNRMLGFSDSRLTLFARDGERLAETRLAYDVQGNDQPAGGSATHQSFNLGPNGVLVGGSGIAAYQIHWKPENSAWSQQYADARNTRRAPAQFVNSPRPVQSVALAQVTDQVYAGYEATLRAAIDGSGPFVIQWRHNGEDIAGAEQPEFKIPSVQMSDAGDYTVVVTNPGGSAYSQKLTVAVFAPTPATPGTYFGLVQQVAGFPTSMFCLRVYPDRNFDMFLTGRIGEMWRGRLTPQGAFPKGIITNVSGTVNGSAITINGFPAGALPASTTGVAPNGLPAGLYLGRVTTSAATAINLVVLADGTVGSTFWVSGGEIAGRFEANSLTTQIEARSVPLPVQVTLEADPEGVIRGYSDDPEVEPFVATWVGRPEVERLANLSTRGYVSPDLPPMIAGFVVTGTTPHSFLLRGVGPELANYGISEPLQLPRVRLMDGTGAEVDRNEGWWNGGAAGQIKLAAVRLAGLQFPDASNDAALLQVVDPGLYTMTVESRDGQPGIALAEIYEDVSSGSDSRLRNLSTRGTLGSGDRVLIGGFYVSGRVPKTFLIRGAGPALLPYVGSAFPVASNPRLRVYPVGASVPFVENDNWNAASASGDIRVLGARIGAFPFDDGSLDAAVLVSLAPGGYSVVVDNLGADTGVGLLEVYEIPPQ